MPAEILSEELFQPTYSTVIGVADIGTAVKAVVVNAALSDIADRFAFRYSISSIDEYTYVPALAGASKGKSELALDLEIDLAFSGVTAGVSSTGNIYMSTSTSRYGYSYPQGPTFPGSPSDGDLFQLTTGPTGPGYFIYNAGTSTWSQTNRPEGKYGTGEYS